MEDLEQEERAIKMCLECLINIFSLSFISKGKFILLEFAHLYFFSSLYNFRIIIFFFYCNHFYYNLMELLPKTNMDMIQDYQSHSNFWS
jgi:hypothetical protein